MTKHYYGRMRADHLAPTLKQNFIGFESGMYLHPTQHRTLSPRETLVVHTVSQYAYDWGDAGSTEVASAIGESVPPLFFETLTRHLTTAARERDRRAASTRPLEGGGASSTPIRM